MVGGELRTVLGLGSQSFQHMPQKQPGLGSVVPIAGMIARNVLVLFPRKGSSPLKGSAGLLKQRLGGEVAIPSKSQKPPVGGFLA